jgi:predicted DNA-binding protein YlxM (UPF0122 family)
MDNKKRIKDLKEEKYQEIFGIRKPTFLQMLEILECEYKELHKQGGRPPRLSVLDKLVIMLGYYHDYRTMENIAFDYNVSKSRISDAVKWVEETLIKSDKFALPSKRELLNKNSSINIVIIDATECETERPKKNKKRATQERKKDTQ